MAHSGFIHSILSKYKKTHNGASIPPQACKEPTFPASLKNTKCSMFPVAQRPKSHRVILRVPPGGSPKHSEAGACPGTPLHG